ncbi:sensor histidine kinase [Paenibacillus lutrae]|uniref:histidine kinase n=1 Tax=Paenibacillus lutrae TaxID=2078573 RepID=A0A7X3FFU9_9BACL|nr:histidine kinase [Paenibacillus lutrae]MVO98916.1 sensor histidine kinase [Paenibacillus lutrae]
MSLKTLKWLAVITPALIIGGFEFIRHELILSYLSMEAGNWYITLLTLLLSYFFATWMFRNIERTNDRLARETSKRAVYEERERLARELHDNLAQTLFFIHVKLKQGKTEEATAAVSEIDHHLRQAIYNLRTLPEEGSSFTLRAVKWLQDWELLTGIETLQELSIADKVFTPAEEVQLFAIIQEAFTNIRKHSRASQASIELEASGTSWSLRISDNGLGFAEGDPGRYRYGLAMMQKRAAELNAVWKFHSPPEGGTELSVHSVRRKSNGKDSVPRHHRG